MKRAPAGVLITQSAAAKTKIASEAAVPNAKRVRRDLRKSAAAIASSMITKSPGGAAKAPAIL